MFLIVKDNKRCPYYLDGATVHGLFSFSAKFKELSQTNGKNNKETRKSGLRCIAWLSLE